MGVRAAAAGALGYLALAGIDRLYAAAPGASPTAAHARERPAPWFGWLQRLQAKGDVDLEPSRRAMPARFARPACSCC